MINRFTVKEKISIVIFAAIFFLGSMATSNNLLILCGLYCWIYFLVKIYIYPPVIFSLLFLSYIPFNQTFGHTDFGFLASLSNMSLLLAAFIIGVSSNCKRIRFKCDVFLILFAFLLFEYLRTFSKEGFVVLSFVLCYGLFPALTAKYVLRDSKSIFIILREVSIVFLGYLGGMLASYYFVEDFVDKTSDLTNPITLSYVMLIGFIVFFIMYKKNVLFKLVVAIGSFLMVLYIGQRSMFLSFMSIVLFLFLKSGWDKIYKIIASTIFLLFLIFFYPILLDNIIASTKAYKIVFLQSFLNDLSIMGFSLFSDISYLDTLGTIGIRLWLWSETIINTNFVFGDGLGVFDKIAPEFDYPHNIFLEFYNIGGIVALFVFAFVILRQLTNIYINSSKDNTLLTLGCCYIATLTILLFSSSIKGLFINLEIIYAFFVYYHRCLLYDISVGNISSLNVTK